MDASCVIEVEGHLNIATLPKRIYDAAVSLGVVCIELRFSGGNDEGYLDIVLVDREDDKLNNPECDKLLKIVEAWADDYYHYSGAGDGMPYGDNVIYDFVNCCVVIDSWFSTFPDRESSADDDSDNDVDDDDDDDVDEESYVQEFGSSLIIPLILAP